MNSMAASVARRFMADAIGDPKSLLFQFEEEVKKAESKIPPGSYAQAQRMKGQARAILQETGRFDPETIPGYREMNHLADRARALLKLVPQWAAAYGSRLFVSILQRYALPPTLRKQVEGAARVYAKSRHSVRRKLPGQDFEYLGDFEKLVETLRLHVAVAKEALEKGVEHGAEGAQVSTKVDAGPFMLVNTGGFSDTVMGTVASVVKKVSDFAKQAGFSKVLYGDILVTNTIDRASVLAFYLVNNDEMFVRANVKANIDTVQTVLHELGHRYETKFLRDTQGVARLYRLISGQEDGKVREIQDQMSDSAPVSGDTVVIKGNLWQVKGLNWGRGGKRNVILEDPHNPKSLASISLAGYLHYKGGAGLHVKTVDEDPDYKGFVTNYAKKSPSENFAEMFAFYCMGRLPAAQAAAFEQLCFGGSR